MEGYLHLLLLRKSFFKTRTIGRCSQKCYAHIWLLWIPLADPWAQELQGLVSLLSVNDGSVFHVLLFISQPYWSRYEGRALGFDWTLRSSSLDYHGYLIRTPSTNV